MKGGLEKASPDPILRFAGGSGGMEAWSPVDGSVKMLTPDFPPGGQDSQLSQLISIKDGEELIFYQAQDGQV